MSRHRFQSKNVRSKYNEKWFWRIMIMTWHNYTFLWMNFEWMEWIIFIFKERSIDRSTHHKPPYINNYHLCIWLHHTDHTFLCDAVWYCVSLINRIYFFSFIYYWISSIDRVHNNLLRAKSFITKLLQLYGW